MTKKILSFLILFAIHFIFAQKADFNDVRLEVFVNDKNQKIQSSDFALINKKITPYLSQQTNFSNTVFNLEAELVPTKQHIAEAGLRNIYITNCTLILRVKNPYENNDFGQYSKTITGNGDTAQLSFTNAISRIKSNDPEIAEFIKKTKVQILDYYEKNCAKIIQTSDKLASSGKTQEAYEKLANVLDISNCYKTAKNKRLELYKKQQAKFCEKIINRANIEIAKNNYNTTLDLLSLIDLDSPCIDKANKIINSLETKIKEQQKMELALKIEQFRRATELEKLRILISKGTEYKLDTENLTN